MDVLLLSWEWVEEGRRWLQEWGWAEGGGGGYRNVGIAGCALGD